MDEYSDELDHLQGGQVLFPPQVLLVFGSHGGEKVVRVHDDVHERVEQTEESSVSARGEFHSPPNGGRHETVVDHVQVRDLVELFAQHEEDGVKELGELAEEVPPAELDDHQLVGIVRIVDRLATKTVAP